MSKETRILEFVIDGLLTDGAHHKQWYLEQILTTIWGSTEYIRDLLKEKYNWESGTAP